MSSGICGPRRRSACASAQADKGLHCLLKKNQTLQNVSMESKYPDETLRMRGMNLNHCNWRMFEDTLARSIYFCLLFSIKLVLILIKAVCSSEHPLWSYQSSTAQMQGTDTRSNLYLNIHHPWPGSRFRCFSSNNSS